MLAIGDMVRFRDYRYEGFVHRVTQDNGDGRYRLAGVPFGVDPLLFSRRWYDRFDLVRQRRIPERYEDDE